MQSINAAYCYNVVYVSLCVSVCLLATTVKRVKTDKPMVWGVDAGGTEKLCITMFRSESLAPALLYDSPARRATLGIFLAGCEVQGIAGVRQSYAIGGSNDAACRCQYCSNLSVLQYWNFRSI